MDVCLLEFVGVGVGWFGKMWDYSGKMWCVGMFVIW